MKTMQKSFYFAAMTLLVMSLLLEEVDARRKDFAWQEDYHKELLQLTCSFNMDNLSLADCFKNQNLETTSHLQTVARSIRGPGIPAWAIIVMVAGGQLVVGGVLYLIMRKVVLGNSTGNASYNTVQA